MDRAALLRQLLGVFLGELEEHVRAQNRDLLALEASGEGDERAALIRELLRSAHSLKGAARAVGVAPIEELCHGLEELLTEADSGRRALDKEIFALLFAAVDALEDAGKRLHEGASFEDAPIRAVTEWLARVSARPPSSPPARTVEPPRSPSSSPPPFSSPPTPVPSLPPASQKPAPSRRASSDHDVGHVRVAARKLDALLTQAGELVMAGELIEQRVSDVETIVELFARFRAEWHRMERPLERVLQSERSELFPHRFRGSFERVREMVARLDVSLERLSSEMHASERICHGASSALDAQVKNVRMLPFAEACHGVSRAVRDLAQERGKDIELVVVGGDIEIDRSILEGLKDPLMHLARNAVDHGVEAPNVRRAAGKPARGRVEIAATLRGSQVEVTVADDGRGLDTEAILERARAKGPSREGGLSPDAAARLIFQPGFSTSNELTVVSGRGVGLDVVKSRVEALHGQVDVTSEPGRGTRFSLIVPLTVTTIRAVVAEVGGRLFAIPSTSVERLLQIGASDLRWAEGRPMIVHAGRMLEIASLAELLAIPAASLAELGSSGKDMRVVVVSGRGHALGFVVDELLGVQEILVKHLGRRLRRVRCVSGATTLSGGRLALILSPGELVAEVSRKGASSALASALARGQDDAEGAGPPRKQRILVVDDSVTTRSLAKSILEVAGFEVIVAVDGQDALRLLEEQGADLVVSDVEMPRLDGLGLTAAIRKSRKLERIPVILMTGLGSERDKARGLEVGADAYLVKSAFDKDQLLDTIAQLL